MPPKEKKAKVSDKEAEQVIMKYLETAVKLLADLAERGKITQKEFGKQKIYWRNQEGIEVDPDNLKQLDKKIKSLEAEKATYAEECQALSTEIKDLINAPTNEEAEARIAALTKENAELQAKVKQITENTVEISPEEKKQVESEYQASKLQWKKRKRLSKEISGHLEEGTGKRYKELKEELGLEDDEDYGVSMDNDETTKMKKGEF